LFEQLTSDNDPFDMEDDDDEGEDIIEYHGVSVSLWDTTRHTDLS
jgi:hypothetical protein